MNSPLANILIDQANLPICEYRGVGVVSHFVSAQADWDALRSGCGVYDLGYRSKIALGGADRVRWLNGMVTNNIRDLAFGHGVYAFLLNPQGRILGDLYAYNRGDSISIDTDASQIEKILATFDHYIIMDDVEVRNLSGELTAVGVSGPNSAAVLAAAGFSSATGMQPMQIETVRWRDSDCTLVRIDDELLPSYEVWLPTSLVSQSWDALKIAGASPIGAESIEMQRIVAGRPRYGVDIRERDLPQETEQARALNFNKGCYVGQEIVERIRSRGAVHRKFTGLIADGTLSPGAKIVAGEKEVGEVTSSISLHVAGQQRHLGLGYMRREAASPGRAVTIGGVQAAVSSLPFSEAALRQTLGTLEQRPA